MDKCKEFLSDLVINTKYARYLPEYQRREVWSEIVSRNEAMHLKRFASYQNANVIEYVIKNSYKYVYDKIILPSMRSLQFGGAPIESANHRIYNCAWRIVNEPEAFHEIFYLLLLGVGVGYSVQYHHVYMLPRINMPTRTVHHTIEDSIEGWATAVNILITGYFSNHRTQFNYDKIRPKGTPLLSTGGFAPGSEALRNSLTKISAILENAINRRLSTLEVHDIICHLSDAVLSGGIRRAALLSIFSYGDQSMMQCKSGNFYTHNPQRARANNSVYLERSITTKAQFANLFKQTTINGTGEPGFIFTNDILEYGFNPCCIQKDMLINTVDGLQTVESLVNEPFTAIINGEEYESDGFIKTGTKQIYKLTTQRGYTVKATADHQILTEYGFAPLGELKPGDVVQLNNTGEYLQIYDEHFEAGYYKARGFLLLKKIIEDTRSKEQIEFEDWNFSHLKDLYYTEISDESTGFLAHLFNQCATEVITDTDAYIEFKFPDTQALYYIHLMLQDLGIISTLTPTSIEIHGSNVIRFADCCLLHRIAQLYIGNECKFDKAYTYNAYAPHAYQETYLDPIVSITTEGFEDVYDCEIEDIHMFGCNGILVHNCEISLKNKGVCNLVTIDTHQLSQILHTQSPTQQNNTIKEVYTAAAFIATMQATYTETPFLDSSYKEIADTEALLGVSMTGIQDMADIESHLTGNLTIEGYSSLSYLARTVNDANRNAARLLNINAAKRTTCIKPEGSTSLVCGTSSGLHKPYSEYYIRRVRVNNNMGINEAMYQHNPDFIEKDVYNAEYDNVISVPIYNGNYTQHESDSIRMHAEFNEIKRFKDWIDSGHNEGTNKHNVSYTLKYNKETLDTQAQNELIDLLYENRYYYSGITIFPEDGGGNYQQMPFEPIDKETYHKLADKFKPIDFASINEQNIDDAHLLQNNACGGGGSCELI